MNVLLPSLLCVAVATALLASSAKSSPLHTVGNASNHGHPAPFNEAIDQPIYKLDPKDPCSHVDFVDHKCVAVDEKTDAELLASTPAEFREVHSEPTYAVCFDPDGDGECGGTAPTAQLTTLDEITNWLEAGRRDGKKTGWHAYAGRNPVRGPGADDSVANNGSGGRDSDSDSDNDSASTQPDEAPEPAPEPAPAPSMPSMPHGD